MIPETIVIQTNVMNQSFLFVCPSFLFGLLAGILLVSGQFRQAGYRAKWNRIKKKIVVEKIDDESKAID